MVVRRHGFTLLEVLITTVMLVIGVIAVVKAIADASSADHAVEGKAVALLLAQEKMETLNYNAAVAESKAVVDGVSFPQYSREVTVSGTDPKKVTVTVYWTPLDVEQSVYYSTLFANPSPG
ncbi:MAG: prepilin-type N-terminal cleavage/methylation domain-containing protein [Candidatus Omnitrophota bacterium]